MKKHSLKYLFLLLFIPAMFSCNKDEETENISRKTEFAVFEMQGDQFQSLVVGDTYIEPGVTATEGGAETTVTTTGTVDTSTPGIYTITYSAVNVDGFPGSVTRTVAVLPQAEQPGVNIAGNYANVGSFGFTAKITKLAPGFYHSNNVWGGASAAVIPAYIFTSDGTNVTLPLSQLSGYGRVEGTGTIDGSGLMEIDVTLLDQGPITVTKLWQRQ